LQIDFGERRIVIAGVATKVFLFVATLGYSRRLHVRAFRDERQESWFEGLESTFRHFGGVAAEVLFDSDDIAGVLGPVQQGAGALIELLAARLTAGPAIALGGALGLLGHGFRSAFHGPHPRPPRCERRAYPQPSPRRPEAVARALTEPKALAETINGLYEAEVMHRRGPWRSFGAVEFATLEWVDWFNHRRLLEPIGNVPPAEAEARYYDQMEVPARAA
jgi:hypothetical protein